MSWKRWLPLLLTGLGFATVEVLAAPTGRPAIGSGPAEIAFGVLLLCGLHVAAGGLARRLGSRAVVVPIVLWAMVWGPEQARARGLPVAVGWVAPAALAVIGSRAPAVAAAASLVGALPVGRGEGASPPERRCAACPDIVLVTVDTVRADAGLAEAAGAAEWSQGTGISAAPWTPPSMQSLFLGAPVPVHGAGVEVAAGVRGRPSREPGIADILLARGYTTAAFVSNPHLREDAGFARGFTVWAHADDAPAPLLLLRTGRLGASRWLGLRPSSARTDGDIIQAARTWLSDTAPGGRFLWVHLMGPHAWPREGVSGGAPAADDDAARRVRYAAHVRQAGGALVDLWAELPTDSTAVLTSDHGELLGEGGQWGHGRSLSSDLLRVPLLIQSPTLRLPAEPARLTGLRAGLMDAASGTEHVLALADGAVVGGVRGDTAAVGVWRGGRVEPASVEGDPMPGIAPLDARDRAALEALGYLSPEGEP
jgi:hypothetical protein